MNKPKAVMVPFGYWGYPEDLLDKLQKDSQDMLKSLDIDVTTVSRANVWEDAAVTAAELRQQDFDFMVVLNLAWSEALIVTETIQEHFLKPILLWSHTMWKDEPSGEFHNVGAVAGMGVLRETFEEMGLRFKFVWGMPLFPLI